MIEIKLHNTKNKTEDKPPFNPIDPENVRMYVCGPTVYDRAHIGNARPVVVFDTLFRLLRHVYGDDHVTYVRNFTDVDDKINKKAADTGRPIRDITDETISWYHQDMDALGALRPTDEPRATEYIGQMIAMIKTLIEHEHAYPEQGHVLFDVKSYPDYGKLARRSLDDMQAGARVEVAPYKRDPMDFVLWKPSEGDLPGWDSPWGYGRPGWHIECSAMSFELLGPSFDIHGGGIDLAFPHHENELAQSCCAHPEGSFANVWMHNGFLQVEGEKMSKSLGNFFTVHDLLEQGIPGEVIRFVLLSTNYRHPIDWTTERVVEARARLHGYVELIAMYADLDKAMALEPDPEIIENLADDLNTHAAFQCLNRMNGSDDADRLARNLVFLGFFSKEKLSDRVQAYNDGVKSLKLWEARLQAAREEAMISKDFSEVDRMKQMLTRFNVSVQMSKEGVNLRPEMDFESSKLAALK